MSGIPRLFGGAKGRARGNEPDAFGVLEDARRRRIQDALLPDFAEHVATRIGRPESWVYSRVEGHAAMTPALERELLRELRPDVAVAIMREDAAALGLAVARIPQPTALQASPVAQLAAALPALARAAEASVNALLDGIVTAEEVETVRPDAEAAVILVTNAVATLEVAAGRRLL